MLLVIYVKKIIQQVAGMYCLGHAMANTPEAGESNRKSRKEKMYYPICCLRNPIFGKPQQLGLFILILNAKKNKKESKKTPCAPDYKNAILYRITKNSIRQKFSLISKQQKWQFVRACLWILLGYRRILWRISFFSI